MGVKKSFVMACFCLALVFTASTAHAVLLSYTFSGVAGAGSLIDTGLAGDPSDVSGVAFTITGQTTSDVDVESNPGFGVFTATSTYDFGVLGSFTTDIGAEGFLQNCVAASSVQCIGLTSVPLDLASFVGVIFLPGIPGSPNIAGSVLGTLPVVGTLGTARSLSNTAGHSLTLTVTDSSISAASVAAVPEPTTLILASIALLGACRQRRKSIRK